MKLNTVHNAAALHLSRERQDSAYVNVNTTLFACINYKLGAYSGLAYKRCMGKVRAIFAPGQGSQFI